MSLNLSTLGRNVILNAITNLIDAGSAQPNGWLEIRTGNKPTSPQIAATGTLLAVLPFSNPAFAAAVNGTAQANPIGADTDVDATGIAKWFRIYNRDGQAVWDGDITITNGTGDIVLDNINFVIHGTVALTSISATMPQ